MIRCSRASAATSSGARRVDAGGDEPGVAAPVGRPCARRGPRRSRQRPSPRRSRASPRSGRPSSRRRRRPRRGSASSPSGPIRWDRACPGPRGPSARPVSRGPARGPARRSRPCTARDQPGVARQDIGPVKQWPELPAGAPGQVPGPPAHVGSAVDDGQGQCPAVGRILEGHERAARQRAMRDADQRRRHPEPAGGPLAVEARGRTRRRRGPCATGHARPCSRSAGWAARGRAWVGSVRWSGSSRVEPVSRVPSERAPGSGLIVIDVPRTAAAISTLAKRSVSGTWNELGLRVPDRNGDGDHGKRGDERSARDDPRVSHVVETIPSAGQHRRFGGWPRTLRNHRRARPDAHQNLPARRPARPRPDPGTAGSRARRSRRCASAPAAPGAPPGPPTGRVAGPVDDRDHMIGGGVGAGRGSGARGRAGAGRADRRADRDAWGHPLLVDQLARRFPGVRILPQSRR